MRQLTDKIVALTHLEEAEQSGECFAEPITAHKQQWL